MWGTVEVVFTLAANTNNESETREQLSPTMIVRDLDSVTGVSIPVPLPFP